TPSPTSVPSNTPTATATFTPTNTSLPTASPTATPTAGAITPPAPSRILSPAPGSILPSSSVTFFWTSSDAVGQYWLDVGTTPGGTEVYSQSQGTRTFATVNGLPTATRLYARLWQLVAGTWLYADY